LQVGGGIREGILLESPEPPKNEGSMGVRNILSKRIVGGGPDGNRELSLSQRNAVRMKPGTNVGYSKRKRLAREKAGEPNMPERPVRERW